MTARAQMTDLERRLAVLLSDRNSYLLLACDAIVDGHNDSARLWAEKARGVTQQIVLLTDREAA